MVRYFYFFSATDLFSTEHADDLPFRPTADLNMFLSKQLVRFIGKNEN